MKLKTLKPSLLGLIVLLTLISGMNLASAGYTTTYSFTSNMFDYSHTYGDDADFSRAVSSTYGQWNKMDLHVATIGYSEYVYAYWDSSLELGSGYLLYSDGGSYSAKINFYLDGTVDASKAGLDKSYLYIKLELYYYSGGEQVVTSATFKTNYDYVMSYGTLETNSASIPYGKQIYIETTVKLYGKSTLKERIIENDFYGGSNGIYLKSYSITNY